MAYKYPICDVFHWFCKIARFFATEPFSLPWFSHQFLMQSQQNSLVSLLVPKVMYPSLRFRSYMPCGITTPSENELKSWSIPLPSEYNRFYHHGRNYLKTLFFTSILIIGFSLFEYSSFNLSLIHI